MLLRFRHVVILGAPENAPGFPACRDPWRAGKCSCISGMPAIHGARRKILLHFRHAGHPWPAKKARPKPGEITGGNR
jgi:hypothetical protein